MLLQRRASRAPRRGQGHDPCEQPRGLTVVPVRAKLARRQQGKPLYARVRRGRGHPCAHQERIECAHIAARGVGACESHGGHLARWKATRLLRGGSQFSIVATKRMFARRTPCPVHRGHEIDAAVRIHCAQYRIRLGSAVEVGRGHRHEQRHVRRARAQAQQLPRRTQAAEQVTTKIGLEEREHLALRASHARAPRLQLLHHVGKGAPLLLHVEHVRPHQEGRAVRRVHRRRTRQFGEYCRRVRGAREEHFPRPARMLECFHRRRLDERGGACARRRIGGRRHRRRDSVRQQAHDRRGGGCWTADGTNGTENHAAHRIQNIRLELERIALAVVAPRYHRCRSGLRSQCGGTIVRRAGRRDAGDHPCNCSRRPRIDHFELRLEQCSRQPVGCQLAERVE